MRTIALLVAVGAAAAAVAACGGDGAASAPFFEQECPAVEAVDDALPGDLPRLDGARVVSASTVNDVDLSVQVLDDTSIAEVKRQLDALRPVDAAVVHDEEEPYDTELSWHADGRLWITAARLVCQGRVEARLSVQDAPD